MVISFHFLYKWKALKPVKTLFLGPPFISPQKQMVLVMFLLIMIFCFIFKGPGSKKPFNYVNIYVILRKGQKYPFDSIYVKKAYPFEPVQNPFKTHSKPVRKRSGLRKILRKTGYFHRSSKDHPQYVSSCF